MALKGNAVIGQSGGPTAVINQSLVGAIEEARKHSGSISGFYGALHGVQGILNEEMVDLLSESKEDLELIARSPSATLGSIRMKPTVEDCHRIFEILQAHDVRYFFYIGGNDSAETANILRQVAADASYELSVFHIPKTIDNDLLVTDHCPGYGSAARFVALAFMGDSLDNRSLPGVKINVVMGRHAGFLTAASALGRQNPDDGPHLIYVPEVPFTIDRFLSDVTNVLESSRNCVIAVSEGIVDEAGQPIFKSGERDSHGNVQLSGSGALGDFLTSLVKKSLKISRVRADTFGYLQRCFPTIVSEVDSREAREVGRHAVRAALSGEHASGSVSIRRLGDNRVETLADYASETFITPLESVAKHTRELDRSFLNDRGNDVTRTFLEYAGPLVGSLQRIGHLQRRLVPRRFRP